MISAPDTTSATSGLGFSVTATITDPDPSDSVVVSVTGAPDGTRLSIVRVTLGTTIATLGGVVSQQTPAQDRSLTWEAIDTEGQSTRLMTTVRFSPPEAASGTMADRVWRVIRRRYEFGIPAKSVRDLGPDALPHLLAILRDGDKKRQWANTVAAIGFLGLPSAYDSLYAFIWNRFRGDVDDYTFKALARAQAAVGLLSPGAPAALDYLIASTDPAYWAPLPWRYRYLTQGGLGIIMSGRSIYGLSVSADGRAVAALSALDTTPFDSRQRDYIREGIARQTEVLKHGWMAARESVQRRSAGEP